MLLLALGTLLASAQTYTPEDIRNIRTDGSPVAVADPAGLLSKATREAVDARLAALRAQTTAEVAVVVVPSIGDTPIEDWNEQVFTSCGIGKKDKDNGALLTIAVNDRKTHLTTGYGLEGVLTDYACKQIVERTVIPNMKAGNLDQAVDQSTTLICEAVSDPAVAEELRSTQGEGQAVQYLSKEILWQFACILATMAFLFCLALFCWDLVANSRSKYDNYQRAVMWRRHLVTYFIGGILSMLTGMIFFLLALFIYRMYRTKPRRCPTCGHKMKRLSEEQDNELLSDSQDFEEKIKTVDYDVWECPQCGTIERFPFKANQKKYTECPACHTVAMCLECDRIVVPATTRREGRGERIYECRYCHHQKRIPYRIPPKDDGMGGLMAGAVAGSILSGGRGGGGGFGGGSFGGGFGGGSTGGGGAGGSW